MTDLSKFLTKVTPQRDPGQERAYALGAFETVQYMYDIMVSAEDPDLKRLIRDEYMRTRERLHDAIMSTNLIRADAEKGGNGPTSEEDD